MTLKPLEYYDPETGLLMAVDAGPAYGVSIVETQPRQCAFKCVAEIAEIQVGADIFWPASKPLGTATLMGDAGAIECWQIGERYFAKSRWTQEQAEAYMTTGIYPF